jgi:hypothetical protein
MLPDAPAELSCKVCWTGGGKPKISFDFMGMVASYGTSTDGPHHGEHYPVRGIRSKKKTASSRSHCGQRVRHLAHRVVPFSMTSNLPSPHSSVGKPDMQSSAGDVSFNCGFNSQLGIENTDAFDCWGFNSHDSTLSLVFSTSYNEDIKVATLISHIP